MSALNVVGIKPDLLKVLSGWRISWMQLRWHCMDDSLGCKTPSVLWMGSDGVSLLELHEPLCKKFVGEGII